MSTYQYVNYSVNGSIAEIRINRPDDANSLSIATLGEMLDVISQANSDDNIRVIILAAEGKLFCAGADLKDISQDKSTTELLMTYYLPVLNAIRTSHKPFIASVQGGAAGVGTSFVMVCDLAIMAEHAYMYQAFAPIGLIPDGGATWLLQQQIGHKKAFELIAFAEKLPAQQCCEYGLVNKVVAADELEACVQEWAEKLASKAPLSMKYSKQLLHQASQSSYQQSFELEAIAQGKLEKTEDAMEGISAFLQKRKPNFKGK